MSEVMMSEFENSGSQRPTGGLAHSGLARPRAGRRARRSASVPSAPRSIEIPFIEIRPPRSFKSMDESLKLVAEYEWLILTSVNGVRAMFERMTQLNIPRRVLAHLNIAAIGPATRAAIEREGFKVAVMPKEYVAESIVESLCDKVRGKRVLLCRAKIARDVIPRELRHLGAFLDVVEAYETVIPQSSRVALRAVLRDPQRRPHIITFTSSSTVKNYVALLGIRSGRSRSGGRRAQRLHRSGHLGYPAPLPVERGRAGRPVHHPRTHRSHRAARRRADELRPRHAGPLNVRGSGYVSAGYPPVLKSQLGMSNFLRENDSSRAERCLANSRRRPSRPMCTYESASMGAGMPGGFADGKKKTEGLFWIRNRSLVVS